MIFAVLSCAPQQSLCIGKLLGSLLAYRFYLVDNSSENVHPINEAYDFKGFALKGYQSQRLY